MSQQSTHLKFRERESFWLFLYLLLAGLAICAVIATLNLNYQAISIYDRSIRTDSNWSELSDSLATLRDSANSINTASREGSLEQELIAAKKDFLKAQNVYEFALSKYNQFISEEPVFVRQIEIKNKINQVENNFESIIDIAHRISQQRVLNEQINILSEINSMEKATSQLNSNITELSQILHSVRKAERKIAIEKAHGLYQFEYSIVSIAVLAVVFVAGVGFVILQKRIKSNQKIQDHATKLNAIFDHAISAIICIDENGIVQSANPACEKIFGSQSVELVGQNIKILVPEHHREQHDSYISNYITQSSSNIIGLTRELTGQRKDGKVIEVQLSVSEVWNNDQRLFAGMIHDLSETKETENQLAQLHSLVESCDDAIISHTIEGKITYWNEGAVYLYGYTRDEAIGMNISSLTPKDLCEEEQCMMDWVLKGHRTEHYDSVRIDKHGNQIDVSLNISPIKDSDESVIGVSVIARDVSNQYLAMQEVLAGQEKAEKANQVKSEFLANMSHEIRTPMTAILGYSELLLDNISESENRESVLTIKRNGQYLLDIINDILDLSKIESGKIEIETIECSPISIVRDVLSLMQVRADAKNLKLTSEFIDAMPCKIKSDPTRLRQMLVNLVGNAIKFTEVGQVSLSSRIFEFSGSYQWQIDVIDTGIGISKAAISKLFKPFAQADNSTTRKYGGTGLGLSITKRLTEMLGGTITVLSEEGKGSTFRLCIDLGILSEIEFVDTPSVSNSSNIEPAVKETQLPKLNSNVLLAEDGADNQRLISFVLKKAGAEVTVVENGLLAYQQAMEALEGNKPFDVILMDMQMPVLDGYQAAAKLRESGYQLPVIALTAHAMESDRQKCIDAGCDDFATKPIDRMKLTSLIQSYTKKNLVIT